MSDDRLSESAYERTKLPTPRYSYERAYGMRMPTELTEKPTRPTEPEPQRSIKRSRFFDRGFQRGILYVGGEGVASLYSFLTKYQN